VSPPSDDLEKWQKCWDEFRGCLRACSAESHAVLVECLGRRPSVRVAHACGLLADQVREDCHDVCSARYRLCRAEYEEREAPRRTKKTPEQKDAFDALARRCAVAGIPLAVAGLALIAFAPGAVVAGGVLAIGAAILGYASYEFDRAADDPPDSQYRKLPKLRRRSLQQLVPELESSLSGEQLSDEQIAEVLLLASLIPAAFSSASYLEAIATCLDRAAGAARAGDQNARQRQLRAARVYALSAAESLEKEVSLRAEVTTRFRNSEWGQIVLPYADAVAAHRRWQEAGLPRVFSEALKRLKLGREPEARITQVILASPPRRGDFNKSLASVLADPGTVKAQRAASKALKEFGGMGA
jgi:hypothetical protein